MILGIDPGIHGALALIDDGDLVALWDMPIVVSPKNKRQKVDGAQLASWLGKRHIDHAWLEQVGASASRAGSFAFGRSVGIVEGVLETLGIPVTRVAPQTWKPAMGCAGSDKSVSRAKAAELLPGYAKLFARVKDDGRAEAALIGLYGVRLV